MSNIKLVNWYIDDNNLSTSLVHFRASIRPSIEEENIIFLLSLFRNNKLVSILKFNSLEDAVNFTNEVVFNANSLSYVLEEYDSKKLVKKL